MSSFIFPDNGAEWRNESVQKPPKGWHYVRESGADGILKAAYQNIATVWQGDFHNAKQVLSAMKKRARKPAAVRSDADIAALFHAHRMKQAQQSRILNMLAVEIRPGFVLDNKRAPDIRAALLDVYGEADGKPFFLPLNLLLGFMGAHEWHKKGVAVPQLGGSIHVPFGVFSPLRGEYLDLLAHAPSTGFQTAFDIGTGSGVLAAILAKQGIPSVIGTDTNPKAVACARANIARLGFEKQVEIRETDLFPEGFADLIVCNPPWLPAKPTSAVESALYDPESAMLAAFLRDAPKHLNPDGEIRLIISDLAEHLGLRPADFLEKAFIRAGLRVADMMKTKPKHKKVANPSDPLAFARTRETTFLYRLKKA